MKTDHFSSPRHTKKERDATRNKEEKIRRHIDRAISRVRMYVGETEDAAHAHAQIRRFIKSTARQVAETPDLDLRRAFYNGVKQFANTMNDTITNNDEAFLFKSYLDDVRAKKRRGKQSHLHTQYLEQALMCYAASMRCHDIAGSQITFAVTAYEMTQAGEMTEEARVHFTGALISAYKKLEKRMRTESKIQAYMNQEEDSPKKRIQTSLTEREEWELEQRALDRETELEELNQEDLEEDYMHEGNDANMADDYAGKNSIVNEEDCFIIDNEAYEYRPNTFVSSEVIGNANSSYKFSMN